MDEKQKNNRKGKQPSRQRTRRSNPDLEQSLNQWDDEGWENPEIRRRRSIPKRRTTSSRKVSSESKVVRRQVSTSVKRQPFKTRPKRGISVIIPMILVLIAFVVCGIFAARFLKDRFGPTHDPADLKAYFDITNEDQVAIILDNHLLDLKGKLYDGQPYVDFEFITKHLNNRFYWDEQEQLLLYTLPEEVISIAADTREYTIANENHSNDYAIVRMEGSTPYLAVSFIAQYSNITSEFIENPNRLVITSQWGEINVAEAKRDTPVRELGGIKSPVLTELNSGDTVIVNEVEEKLADWIEVSTTDGFRGYVAKGDLKEEKVETISNDFVEPVFPNISKPYTINLTWHQVTSYAANESLYQMLTNTKGITTVSPTWFTLVDNEGNMGSIATSEYVDYVHQQGMEVWALIDNFGEEIDTYEILRFTSKRTNLINQLMDEVQKFGIDGINVDFESLTEETGKHFIQFIRELSVKCRLAGIVLSIDNYVPMNFNSFYDIKEQGRVADYVIIMGYDEHYSGSPQAGSVASIGFVEQGILNTIALAPAEKTINGVPLYTRIWTETLKPQSQIDEEVAAGLDAANYNMSISSKAYGMKEAWSIVQEAGVEPTWNEETGQYYAEWDEDGSTLKVWLENADSLIPRLELMKQHNLAGVASWKLGFETPDIWETILQYMQ